MSDPVPQDSGASCDKDRALRDGAATRHGRWALMLGAAAAGAGITLGLVGDATPADVTNDNPVLLGETNTGTSAPRSTPPAGTAS